MIFWEGEMNCYLDGDVEQTRVSIKINKKTRNLELNDNLKISLKFRSTRENWKKRRFEKALTKKSQRNHELLQKSYIIKWYSECFL